MSLTLASRLRLEVKNLELRYEARPGFFARRSFFNDCRDDDDEGSDYEGASQPVGGRHRRFARCGIPAKNKPGNFVMLVWTTRGNENSKF